MVRHPLIFALALSLCTASVGDDWWDGSDGYQSSGGFKTTLNKGRVVGTPESSFEDNLSKFVNSQGKNTDPQINPATGQYETPAERIIRQSHVDPNLFPNAKKETVGTNGDPNSPGRLGLDEKLTEAANIAAIAAAGEKAQMTAIGVAGFAEVGMMAVTNPAAAAEENEKLQKQYDIYKANAEIIGEAQGDYTRGAAKLTRDSHLADPQGPTVSTSGSGTGNPTPGSNNSGGKVTTDDNAIRGVADKLLAGFSPEKQEFLRENGVSPSDFAMRLAEGQFKSPEEVTAFIKASAGGSVDDSALKGGAGEAGARAMDKTEFANLGNDEGAVLSVKSGTTFAPVPQGEANAGGKDLISSLASYLSGGKDRGLRVVDEDSGEVSEKEKRALLSFAMDYWAKVKGLEDKFNKSGLFGDREPNSAIGRRRTIFDIASERFRRHGNDGAPLKTKGPVALR